MLMVIAYHFALHFGLYHSPVIVRGDIGVDLFFFLSGYGCGFSVNKNSSRVFYANRLKRIIPIYIIIESINILCNYVLLNRQMANMDVYRLFCVSFFIHGDLSVWYIHASLLFYLLTPLMVAMLRRHGLMAFSYLMPCVAIAIYLCTYLHHTGINLMLYRFVSYNVGLLCALVALGKCNITIRQIIGGGISYFLLMFVLQIILKRQDLLVHNQLRYIIYPVLMSGIVYFCCNHLPKYKILSCIGLCSLECYLVHQPIMEYLSAIQNKLLFVGFSLLAIALCVTVFHNINIRLHKYIVWK